MCLCGLWPAVVEMYSTSLLPALVVMCFSGLWPALVDMCLSGSVAGCGRYLF